MIALLLAFAAASVQAQAEDVGKIVSIDPSGSTVMVKTGTAAPQAKAAGAALSAGDHVLPGVGQTAVLMLKDGSEVTAAPGADLSVSDYVPSQKDSVPHLELGQGSAHFDVNKSATGHPSFYIRTRSATMGVRGTEFVVDQRTDDYSVVHTLQGTVSVAKTEKDLDDPSKSVNVGAGHTTYMHPKMSVPAKPKVFNRRAYLTNLQKNYPGLMKQVKASHRKQLEQRNEELKNEARKTQKESTEEQEKSKPKRKPIKRKQ